MKVSIITAVLNNQDHIAGCLQSVLEQTHGDLEHIVVDGGSRDGTEKILERRSARPVRVLRAEARGVYAALNQGIREASGDVVGILHSDDFYAGPQVVEEVVDAFRNDANGGADCVYGDLVYVRRNAPDRIVRRWKAGYFDRSNLEKGWMPPHPSLFVRKSVYREQGMYDASYSIASDYDFMLRILLKRKTRVRYLPRTLVTMRLGGVSNRSLSCVLKKSAEDLAIIKQHRLPHPWLTLTAKNMSKLTQFWGPLFGGRG